jgi:hypothetical protein
VLVVCLELLLLKVVMAEYSTSSTEYTEQTELIKNWTLNDYSTYLHESTTQLAEGLLACPKIARPCHFPDYCLNGGLCCWYHATNISGCTCTNDYTGGRCEKRTEGDLDYETLQSREKSMVMAGITSIISLVIGLLALIAFITLVIFLIRKKILQQQHPKESLDRHMSEIQEELDRLPTVSKLIQLGRLTKIFEATTVATVKAAVLKAAVQPSFHECLPRWSSAPSVLIRPADEPDSSLTGHNKLKQIFSMMDEKQIAQRQQQQQNTRL